MNLPRREVGLCCVDRIFWKGRDGACLGEVHTVQCWLRKHSLLAVELATVERARACRKFGECEGQGGVRLQIRIGRKQTRETMAMGLSRCDERTFCTHKFTQADKWQNNTTRIAVGAGHRVDISLAHTRLLEWVRAVRHWKTFVLRNTLPRPTRRRRWKQISSHDRFRPIR